MKVRGRDRRGFQFEETTACENLCRGGAAFLTRFDVDPGAELEITIPSARVPSHRADAEFATHGRIVHIGDLGNGGERLVGVQFVGPRFQRVFRPETAA
jgi:hypothetical protein